MKAHWDLSIIGGQLVDEKGVPVKEALVGAAARKETAVARTNARGRFALSINATGPVRIVARKKGHVFGIRRDVKPGTMNLEMVLPRAGGMTGKVVARPMPKRFRIVVTRIEATKRAKATGCSVLRLPGGLFSVNRLTAGVYELIAEADGLTGEPFVIDLEPGEIIVGIELQLRRAR
jgi:hypothetical protein